MISKNLRFRLRQFRANSAPIDFCFRVTKTFYDINRLLPLSTNVYDRPAPIHFFRCELAQIQTSRIYQVFSICANSAPIQVFLKSMVQNVKKSFIINDAPIHCFDQERNRPETQGIRHLRHCANCHPLTGVRRNWRALGVRHTILRTPCRKVARKIGAKTMAAV